MIRPLISVLMKRLLPVVALFLIYSGFFTASCQNNTDHQVPYVLPPELEVVVEDTVTEIRITAIGDLMCHSTQYKFAYTDDGYDFHPCFAEVKPILESADYTIGNIETTFSGGRVPYSGYPNFNTPVEYLVAIKDAGFDFLVSANNHTMDTGEKGVMSTIKRIDSLGFARTGSYISQEDRDSIRVVDIDGITMAILNYTYGMNGYTCPEGKDWMVNLIDTVLIKEDIAAAKALQPDLVCVFYHYGAEYIHEPNLYQRECVDVAIRSGADLILGAHPHVVQPIETFATRGGNIDTGVVVWSMGNFVSNQGQRYRDAGIIVNLELSKDLRNEKVKLTGVDYVPTWVFRGNHPNRKPHTIIPSEKGLEADHGYDFIDEKDLVKMQQGFADVNKYATLYQDIPRTSYKEYGEQRESVPDKILFHSGVCFGTCPDYALSVDQTGHLEMWGGTWSDKRGFYTGKVPDHLVKEIQFFFSPDSWKQAKSNYQASFTDASTFQTSYVENGRIVKQIRDYGAQGPQLLKSFYGLMRDLYKADIWEALPPSALTCYDLKLPRMIINEQPVQLNKAELLFLWQEWRDNLGILEPAYEFKLDPAPEKDPKFFSNPGAMHQCLESGLDLDSVTTDGQRFQLHFEEEHNMRIDLGYDFFGSHLFEREMPSAPVKK